MAWDTYVVIAVLSGVIGYYLVKGLFPKCPECGTRMRYTGAVDPKFEKMKGKGSSSQKAPNFNDLRPGFFTISPKSERIKFQYQCPSCGHELEKQGR